jgi:hypothetical protein
VEAMPFGNSYKVSVRVSRCFQKAFTHLGTAFVNHARQQYGYDFVVLETS